MLLAVGVEEPSQQRGFAPASVLVEQLGHLEAVPVHSCGVEEQQHDWHEADPGDADSYPQPSCHVLALPEVERGC